jgi:hypothetical protein
MPCYCDIPNEDDQVTIEKRAKTMMYFSAIDILTFDQIKKNCFGIFIVPLPDENTALCNICKFMTEEQMKSIDASFHNIKWAHKTLYDWYSKHLEDDKRIEET